MLHDTPGVASARALSDGELADLLRPWLGAGAERLSLPLPAVIAVRLAPGAPDPEPLAARLAAAVPGTLTESHGVWMQRLGRLAGSLQACAWLALAVVAAVAAAVVAIATRAGLAARREAIEIVHGLGATDGYIAGRFAGRATVLAAAGGLLGALAALPVLLLLARLAAPFAGVAGRRRSPTRRASPCWPPCRRRSGWRCRRCRWPRRRSASSTAQGTVRRWLRRLP